MFNYIIYFDSLRIQVSSHVKCHRNNMEYSKFIKSPPGRINIIRQILFITQWVTFEPLNVFISWSDHTTFCANISHNLFALYVEICLVTLQKIQNHFTLLKQIHILKNILISEYILFTLKYTLPSLGTMYVSLHYFSHSVHKYGNMASIRPTLPLPSYQMRP